MFVFRFVYVSDCVQPILVVCMVFAILMVSGCVISLHSDLAPIVFR